MTYEEKQKFIDDIAPYIILECKARGYSYPSAIIGQACIESNFGASQLSAKYFNYFGMKAGKYWAGASVNMKTCEEYTPGTLTAIHDNFRVYADMQDGVKGYFDFIKYSRYDNLKNVKNTFDYIVTIGQDGYYTSSTYYQAFVKIYHQYSLWRYDYTTEEEAKPAEAETVMNDVYIQMLSQAVTVVATRVIKGDYGNGELRKQHLGQYYGIVQDRVNQLCKGTGSAEQGN